MTTATQDVEDFLKNEYGKAVLTNSSIQVLLKQRISIRHSYLNSSKIKARGTMQCYCPVGEVGGCTEGVAGASGVAAGDSGVCD